MTLKEARAYKAKLMKEINTLYSKRDKVALVSIDPSEDFNDYIDITVDAVTQQIDEVIEKVFRVNQFIHRANSLDINGDKRIIGVTANEESINDLLSKAIIYRKEADKCKHFGQQNRRERDRYNGEGNLITVATYDIQKYAERGKEMEAKAEAISAKIDEMDIAICEA